MGNILKEGQYEILGIPSSYVFDVSQDIIM